MANLIAFLSLLLAIILQMTVVTRVNMLHGAADLVLLVLLAWIIHEQTDTHWRWGILAGLLVGLATALPFWIPLIEYIAIVGFVSIIQARIWQAPLLILFTAAFTGTFLINGLDFLFLWLSGTPLVFEEVFNLVLLPSLVLNVLFALPVFGLIGEIAKQFFPAEVAA